MGAAGRVQAVASHFDEVTFRRQDTANRPEFSVAAGTYKGVPMAAFSCGLGTDNTEITLNEFHALFEYDHERNTWTDVLPRINIIRIGTCGAFQPYTPRGANIISQYAIGLDNLGAYYPASHYRDPTVTRIENAFRKTAIGRVNPCAYASAASPEVVAALQQAAADMGQAQLTPAGITTSAPGFFGPEGRQTGRMRTAFTTLEFLDIVTSFAVDDHHILNTEMEASILFRLAHEQLGYRAGAICFALDNLSKNEVIEKDEADRRMDACIRIALGAMVKLAETQYPAV